ncbi:hypothetical protein TorRG33x02_290960, partial [Trema orientale]
FGFYYFSVNDSVNLTEKEFYRVYLFRTKVFHHLTPFAADLIEHHSIFSFFYIVTFHPCE